jgi:hypothetical protein
MASTIALPLEQDGQRRLAPYTLGPPGRFPASQVGEFNRVAYAAAHVVADPLATHDPWLDCAIDWERTLAYRQHLWGLGFGVAEAMDTAQRGMGLAWEASLQLIRESMSMAHSTPGALIACGCGTDQLRPEDARSLDDVVSAYEKQMEAIEALGGQLILMASRALAHIARGADDYGRVYDRLLSQAREPVVLHWLGEMFDPALTGYWGRGDHREAMGVALDVIRRNSSKVDGIKISLLSKDLEIEMRRQLPPAVRMYTGDDFDFPQLIQGDSQGHSHALLGIFDAIAPAAAAALAALAQGEVDEFNRILSPTVALSRHIFRAPTRFYKTGIVFMAYLNGHQDHFTMVAGHQSARSIGHLSEIFRLADQAGLLRDPPFACDRMKHVLAVHGVY